MGIVKYIDVSVILQLLALFYSIYSMSKNDKSEMMQKLFISNFLNLLVYIVSNNLGTALVVFGSTIRCFLFTKKDKVKTNLLFWIAL